MQLTHSVSKGNTRIVGRGRRCDIARTEPFLRSQKIHPGAVFGHDGAARRCAKDITREGRGAISWLRSHGRKAATRQDDGVTMIEYSRGDATLQSGDMAECFAKVRRFTEGLCQPLAIEDYVLQSMPDASPAKWHLAHTSWFFETFVLSEAGVSPFDPRYGYLFNSYYEAAGPRHRRPERGMLSRPTVEEVYRYRAHVDARMGELFGDIAGGRLSRLGKVVELGLHHEQQHQELILTDIKHALGKNPLRPGYRAQAAGREPAGAALPLDWVRREGGLTQVGHAGEGFSFDNETPRHSVYLEPFQVADRLVTNGEFIAFIEEGGYRRPELWLSDGWAKVNEEGWRAPLYWEVDGEGRYRAFTLEGMAEVDPAAPVCHVSYYEADAFARWAGARLPTEAEWEVAAEGASITGNFVESGALAPTPLGTAGKRPGAIHQLFGDAWEWTASPYTAYPGFSPLAGALGEYNGKFMCSQMVLRGGSCATPASHIRPTYRNFFPPHARWQFSGIRLTKSC